MNTGFHTTHWTAILAAKEDRSALMALCETYYTPIRKFIERNVQRDQNNRYGPRDADDLTHDFLSKLLAGGMFEHLRRDRGRFRSYLLGAVAHFLGHVREKESADKRGKYVTFLHCDPDEISISDDSIFDRDWASAIISGATQRLKMEEANADDFLPYLTAELPGEQRRELSRKTKMSEIAVKVALHRLRKRFRQVVREQIATTLDGAEPDSPETTAELDYLIHVLTQNEKSMISHYEEYV